MKRPNIITSFFSLSAYCSRKGQAAEAKRILWYVRACMRMVSFYGTY